MLETSARLLRLLSHLQSRRDWTGPQLAERLGVTTRTVRNDIERLRDQGKAISDRFQRGARDFNRLRFLLESKDHTARIGRPTSASFAGPKRQDRQSV